MKKLATLALFMSCITVSVAQLKGKTPCAELTVDILGGRVNGIKPNVPYAEIKQMLPCFTSAIPETDSAKCGGGIFFKDHDLYFYTGRDYVEIGDKFKGKMNVPLLGAARNSLFSKLGNPVMKNDTWDAYGTQYGTLVLHFNKANKVIKIQFSTLGTDRLSLCE